VLNSGAAAYGDQTGEMRDAFDSSGGWGAILTAFAAVATT
jgi:hypothetical protein